LSEKHIQTSDDLSLPIKADEWRDAGTLDANQYDGELAYFRQRYFGGEFTYHLAHLHLRPADQPNFVRSVLDKSNNDPRDRLLTVMMIVWRFRNNLFHSEKWAYRSRASARISPKPMPC